MFTKENILYSDAYKFLKHKIHKSVSLTASLKQYKEEDFEELPMKDPLDASKMGNYVCFQNRLFLVKVKDFTYAGIKTSIIKSRYSDDDQMALILNKDRSKEDAMLFNKMQEWRDFAGSIARKVAKDLEV